MPSIVFAVVKARTNEFGRVHDHDGHVNGSPLLYDTLKSFEVVPQNVERRSTDGVGFWRRINSGIGRDISLIAYGVPGVIGFFILDPRQASGEHHSSCGGVLIHAKPSSRIPDIPLGIELPIQIPTFPRGRQGVNHVRVTEFVPIVIGGHEDDEFGAMALCNEVSSERGLEE